MAKGNLFFRKRRRPCWKCGPCDPERRADNKSISTQRQKSEINATDDTKGKIC